MSGKKEEKQKKRAEALRNNLKRRKEKAKNEVTTKVSKETDKSQ